MSLNKLLSIKNMMISLGAVGGVLVLIAILFLLLFFLIIFKEEQDDRLFSHIRDISAEEVYQYRVKNNHLPENLAQAGVVNKYCSWGQCAHIEYLKDKDGKNFYLAATFGNIKNGAWTISFYSDQREINREKSQNCCASLTIMKGDSLRGVLKDWVSKFPPNFKE